VHNDPVDQLDREWRQLAVGARLGTRLRAWAAYEPALVPFADPRALIRFLRTPGHWVEKDAVLSALLRRARSEPLAARVVLEALLPGLKRLAGRMILDSGEREQLWQLLLGCAWEQIRAYPLQRRPARIAINLLLDSRRAALADFGRERGARCELPYAQLPVAAVAARSGGDVEALLGRAVAAAAISSAEAELILQSRIDGIPLGTLAVAAGVRYDALRIRRQRAERRLRLFLGQSDVRFETLKAHCSCARVAGGGPAGSTGGGSVTPADKRR